MPPSSPTACAAPAEQNPLPSAIMRHDISRRTTMSANTPAMQSVGYKSYEEVRKAWDAAHVRPLWESLVAHKANEGGPKAHLWQWSQLRGFIDEAMKVTTPAAVE